jgi:uncharacterized membrane protein required for colicin V production
MALMDIILFLLILGFIGAGAKDGFVHTFGRLIGTVLGFIAAKAWYLKVNAVLGIFLPFGWAQLISFVLIFIVITRLVGYAFKIVDGAFSILSFLPFVKTFNKLLGGIVGFVEGIIVLGALIYLVKMTQILPWLGSMLAVSKIAPWIQHIFQIVFALLL